MIHLTYMIVNTDPQKIDAILDRGIIIDILPTKDGFRKALLSGRRLRFYIGADPTSPSLHLSHAKNYMLLEEFRQLGHEAIVLVGDFTARIGDPSGESKKRNQLSKNEIKNNVKTWIKQISPIVDFKGWKNPAKIVYNNKWLSKLSFEEVLDLASNFTVQQMLERNMFNERLKKNDPVYLHEFLYPLMQGYDSVALDVDVEICGTDQTFNALAGRTLLKRAKNKEKFVVTVNLMENPITKELMSKSKGTGVFLDTSPIEMYGAIMAQPDEMIEVLLINNTRIPISEIGKLKKLPNQRDAKMKTALEIVKIFYGEKKATKAEENFVKTFQKKETPEDIEELSIKSGEKLVDVMVDKKITKSKTEARRLIVDGAVTEMEINKNITDTDYSIKKDLTLKIGKKRFIKVSIK